MQRLVMVTSDFEFLKCFPEVEKSKYFLNWKWNGTQEAVFEIFASLDRDGKFKKIAETEMSFVEVDLSSNSNFNEDVWFVVKVFGTNGNLLAESIPFFSGIFPNRLDRLRYREILRRTELDIKRFLGKRSGYLAKRKTHGKRADNVNPVLDLPVGEEDKDSFGKKFDGGYDPVFFMYCGYIQNSRGEKQTTTQEQGLSDVRRLSAVFMPYPTISIYDIWIDADTNDRYQIVPPVKTSTFSGWPIKQICGLSLLPRSDSAYKIEI